MGYLFASGLGANGTSRRTRDDEEEERGSPGRRRSPTSAPSAGRSSRRSRRQGRRPSPPPPASTSVHRSAAMHYEATRGSNNKNQTAGILHPADSSGTQGEVIRRVAKKGAC